MLTEALDDVHPDVAAADQRDGRLRKRYARGPQHAVQHMEVPLAGGP